MNWYCLNDTTGREAHDVTHVLAESPAPMIHDTPARVIGAYLSSSALFTLATSLIWATNTIFLMQVGGLTIFQVMLANSIFSIAQAVFEIPTGVIADTIGRKASYLIAISTILLSTVLYVVTPIMGWGFAGFAVASILVGLGFTFQTGAVDAWLVDALDHVGYTQTKEKVFAWGSMTFGAAMLVGSLLGGLLGQINLSVPFVARAVLLVAAFVVVAVLVHDLGFEPRPLKVSTFAGEARKILAAGVEFGWKDRVVRPLLFVSLVGGVFYMYGFYSWQPYILGLLGKNAVWLLGVVQAGISATGILGNALVQPALRIVKDRDPARVLFWSAVAETVLVVAIGLVGVSANWQGVAPASIAIGLWLAWGVVFGIAGPVRQAFINAHIPSAQRATVLSLDAFFGDAGSGLGQPGLGWVSGRTTIGVGWLIGSVFLGATAPLYAWAGRAARAKAAEEDAVS